MQTDNPYESGSPMDAEPDHPPSEDISAGHAAYNVVSDTVTGLNVRASDNLFQAIFILVTVLLLAAVGTGFVTLYTDSDVPWYGGALLGGLAGLILGFFGSGIFLMVYRAIRHMQGKHK